MKTDLPSIFNDVIGPVMRGPSSSHTAASVRIGKMIRQFMAGKITGITFEFTPGGSLATTYQGQGSDIGLAAGLMGLEPDDPRMKDSLQLAAAAGIKLEFQIVDYEASHPNTYRARVSGPDGAERLFVFISSGGGMIELQSVDELPLSIKGGSYETLFFFSHGREEELNRFAAELEEMIKAENSLSRTLSPGAGLLVVSTREKLEPLALEVLREKARSFSLREVVELSPLLPVLSFQDKRVKVPGVDTLLEQLAGSKKEPWEIGAAYEGARGGLSTEEVLKLAADLVRVMKGAVAAGLAGTEYKDRILGPQASLIQSYSKSLYGGDYMKNLIAYTTAVMEVKSAMGLIVAAPTAGSCGVLPGVLLASAEELGAGEKELARSILAAGAVGVIIAGKSTFAAEECGCQAECGAASAMSAAALVQLAGGNARQAGGAASLALQNILGLVCDPVAERVEVPCLGKNILAGLNAAAAANMILAGFDPLIPLAETVEALDQVGRLLPPELCCTGKAGLSLTKTAQEISLKLDHQPSSKRNAGSGQPGQVNR